MKNAVLLHGLPSKNEYYNVKQPSASNSHWFPWLQKQLLIHEIKADTPEVPHAFKMDWHNWVKEVERFDITPDTTLVGHSMGAGFWIRYLTEHPELFIGKLVLVAPWLNVDHEYDSTFFDFDVDPTLIERTTELIIFASDNDAVSVQYTVRYLQDRFPSAILKSFHNYGHFTLESMKTDAFPELLDVLL